ncbi:DUF2267 domain-containing protein [Streptomyces sp. NBC_00287]|uniref:DUF2267 domain-containing protein n=1 Tax=Streptomyces sp. NBC_00287 TaxID=2975702 RepID=UPI002E29A8DC|nr:DUF2267 domain-containing protein [Streptomyces sp. NBC_00287]
MSRRCRFPPRPTGTRGRNRAPLGDRHPEGTVTLSETLPAAQLPAPLDEALRPDRGRTGSSGCARFLSRVAQETDARPRPAEGDTNAVPSTIADAVCGGQVNHPRGVPAALHPPRPPPPASTASRSPHRPRPAAPRRRGARSPTAPRHATREVR